MTALLADAEFKLVKCASTLVRSKPGYPVIESPLPDRIEGAGIVSVLAAPTGRGERNQAFA